MAVQSSTTSDTSSNDEPFGPGPNGRLGCVYKSNFILLQFLAGSTSIGVLPNSDALLTPHSLKGK